MTRAEAMIEAMARAIFRDDEDNPHWDECPHRTHELFRATARRALAKLLPMLADDLAGVAAGPQPLDVHEESPLYGMGYPKNELDRGIMAGRRTASTALKVHLASLAAAMKGEG